jgi:hypothetical protein
VIRTAGEMRLSNYLIWQAAYAEYYSTPVLWPDFGREDFLAALDAYSQRKRRFGKLDDTVVTPPPTPDAPAAYEPASDATRAHSPVLAEPMR